jgi:hypothetical protein
MSDADLLHVAFVLESKDRLGHLMTLLSAKRRDSLVDVAAAQDLWPETLDLLGHLSHGRRRELAQSVGRRQDDVLEAIVAAAFEHGMWPELLPLIPELPADAQERVARRRRRSTHRYRRLTISSASLAAAASPNDRYSDGSDSSSSISLGSPAPSAIRSTRA